MKKERGITVVHVGCGHEIILAGAIERIKQTTGKIIVLVEDQELNIPELPKCPSIDDLIIPIKPMAEITLSGQEQRRERRKKNRKNKKR
ncbi:MAG: hypothetical protein AB7U05_09140 [Mangrovibacterium sp.]